MTVCTLSLRVLCPRGVPKPPRPLWLPSLGAAAAFLSPAHRAFGVRGQRARRPGGPWGSPLCGSGAQGQAFLVVIRGCWCSQGTCLRDRREERVSHSLAWPGRHVESPAIPGCRQGSNQRWRATQSPGGRWGLGDLLCSLSVSCTEEAAQIRGVRPWAGGRQVALSDMLPPPSRALSNMEQP